MSILIATLVAILYLINHKKINWWFSFNFPLTCKLFKITFITLFSLYVIYILISARSSSQELLQIAIWTFVLFATIFVGINIFILLPILICEHIKNLKNKSK